MFLSQHPRAPQPELAPNDALVRTRNEYIKFCRMVDVTISPDEARLDFEMLVRDKRISHISVHTGLSSVLIGTKLVTLKETENVRRSIGQFLIHLNPTIEKGSALRFENVDHVALRKEQNSCYFHPHIPYNPEGGYICTADAEKAERDVRAGHLREAVEIALDALWSYGPNPYCDITHWPVYEPEGGSE